MKVDTRTCLHFVFLVRSQNTHSCESRTTRSIHYNNYNWKSTTYCWF